MSELYEQIIKACQPYWQVRDNDIHIRASYADARRLVAHYPDADPLVVLPAILMHDNGYARLTEEQIFAGLAGSPVKHDLNITRLHEIEGANIAREILTALDFDAARIEEICTIIDGHDTRKEALSLNDSLVKDADKLWRFTLKGVMTAGVGWMAQEPLAFLDFCTAKIDGWFFTKAANKWAREYSAETRTLLTPPLQGVAFMLIQDNRLLVERRSMSKPLLPGVRAIPGGHVEANETLIETLHRELREELGVEAQHVIPVCSLLHRAEEFRHLHYFAVLLWRGEIENHEAAALEWVALADCERLDLDVDRLAVKEFERVYRK